MKKYIFILFVLLFQFSVSTVQAQPQAVNFCPGILPENTEVSSTQVLTGGNECIINGFIKGALNGVMVGDGNNRLVINGTINAIAGVRIYGDHKEFMGNDFAQML